MIGDVQYSKKIDHGWNALPESDVESVNINFFENRFKTNTIQLF